MTQTGLICQVWRLSDASPFARAVDSSSTPELSKRLQGVQTGDWVWCSSHPRTEHECSNDILRRLTACGTN